MAFLVLEIYHFFLCPFLTVLFNGSGPNLFFPFVPSGIKKNTSINEPIIGIKLINKKNPDQFVSCILLTPAEIAGIKVNKVIPKKK